MCRPSQSLLSIAASEEPVKHLQPHPEERRILRRVSKDGSKQPKSAVADFGDLRAEIGQADFGCRASILRDGRPSKSAVADFDTLGCRSRASPTSVGAPQDEVRFIHALVGWVGAAPNLWKYSSMKLVSIPANPVPEGAVMGVLKTPAGISVRCARWPPPSDRKGTVCIFQGRIEFIEKYFEIVRDLNARGFAVATLDWRGQGLS